MGSRTCDAEPAKQPLPLDAAFDHAARATRIDRLIELSPLDCGDQVIGSKHTLAFESPLNAGDHGAIATARLADTRDLAVDWDGVSLPAGKHGPPVRLTFAPTRAGAYATTLVVSVSWIDGHHELHAVAVTARAHAIDALPEPAPAAPVAAAPATAAIDGAQAVTRDDLRHGLDLGATYNGVTSRQANGVQVIADEARSRVARPEAGSLWRQLAETAMIMGTAAIASVAARLAEVYVAPILVRAVTIGGGEPTTKLAASAVGSLVEDGIKHTAELAIAAHPPSEAPARRRGGVHSADPLIDFFATQRDLITTAGVEGRKTFNGVMYAVSALRPELAGALAGALDQALANAGATAEPSQATATATQLCAFEARSALGSEPVPTAPGRQVTRLDDQRAFATALEPTKLAAGVLELATHVAPATRAVTVTGARMVEVAALVADRLIAMNLREAGVPLRLVINDLAVITRDEAGRVRFAGAPINLPALADGWTEAQQLAEAARIVDAVLARPLAAWGVCRVETGDASQVPSGCADLAASDATAAGAGR